MLLRVERDSVESGEKCAEPLAEVKTQGPKEPEETKERECAIDVDFALQTKEDVEAFETCGQYTHVVQTKIERVYYGGDDVMHDVTKVWTDSKASGGVDAMLVSALLISLANPNATFGDPAPGAFKKVVFVGLTATTPSKCVVVAISEKHCKMGYPVKVECYDQTVATFDVVRVKMEERARKIAAKCLSYLRIHEASALKVRIGSVHDGGYVIVGGHDYDCLLSCGISDDVTFEESFLKHYGKPLRGYAFDGTIDALPKPVPHLEWKKQNVGQLETPKTTNLHKLVEMHENAFLKMDIESHEFPWFQTLSRAHMTRLKQIVVEFHFPFGFHPAHDVGLSVCEKLEVLDKLTQTHVLVHLHVNNCCGITTHQGTIVPNIFECTYLRKDCHIDKGWSSDGVPGKLDAPNDPRWPDIWLHTYPFKPRGL